MSEVYNAMGSINRLTSKPSNLTGEIHNATGLTIDDTLTVRNHAADAKATGEAINAVKTSLNGHADDKANPHGVTKAQVGLGDVDNTADIEKPVSKAQAAAIAEAKKAGTDAQANLDLALLEIGKEDGKALSTNDFTDGYKAKLDGIEAGANKYELADGAVTGNKIAKGAVSQTFTGTLLASGWTSVSWGCYQTIQFPNSGILAHSSAGAVNQHVEVGLDTGSFEQGAANSQALEADEAWDNIFRAIPYANSVQFNFKEVPTIDIPVYAWVVNK